MLSCAMLIYLSLQTKLVSESNDSPESNVQGLLKPQVVRVVTFGILRYLKVSKYNRFTYNWTTDIIGKKGKKHFKTVRKLC